MSSNSVVQQKDSPPSPLIDLHPEIWEFILKKLTQTEALNLQIVSKDFKWKVDNLYQDWVIRLDERSRSFDRILDLRVKEVKVVKLLNPTPHRSQETFFFKFPDLLTKIDVGNSGISGENLDILLQHKNLKIILISLRGFTLQDDFWRTLYPEIGYNFPELLSLEIIFNGYTGELFEGNLSERILTKSRFQNLRSLSVNWGGTLSEELFYRNQETYRLISNMIFSLGQNGKTLKHFSFQSSFLGDVHFHGFPRLDVTALLRTCSSLETLVFSYHREVEVLSHIFKRLIENQSKLVEIKFCTSVTNLTICNKLCANNYESLTAVDLTVFNPEYEGQFDVSVFRNCVNLKKLFLTTGLYEYQTQVLNVSTLPQQIESFESTGFCFYSSDLSSFLKNHGFLSNFSIKWPEANSDYGVNETVLRDGLNHSSLKNVMITQICSGMESSEVEKIDEMLSKLGLTRIDTILQLQLEKTKDSNGNPRWISTNK